MDSMTKGLIKNEQELKSFSSSQITDGDNYVGYEYELSDTQSCVIQFLANQSFPKVAVLSFQVFANGTRLSNWTRDSLYYTDFLWKAENGVRASLEIITDVQSWGVSSSQTSPKAIYWQVLIDEYSIPSGTTISYKLKICSNRKGVLSVFTV